MNGKAPYIVALAYSLLFTSSVACAESEKNKTEANPSAPIVKPLAAPKEAIASAAKHADDVMSKAMEDELLRSVSDLKIEGRPAPYFVSYLGTDSQAFSVYGSFGAIDQVTDGRYRGVATDVRVGDYKLDSSGRRGFGFGSGRRGTCSLDDNYDAIRHELWLGSDFGYKRAIEALDNKKAILQQKKVENLPDSMSKTEPVISMQPAGSLNINKEEWKKTVRDVSGVFREYPAVIDSTVALLSRARTRWFANSEGSLNREGNQGILFGISANGQAADGMRVSDFEMFAARDENALPSKAEIEAKAKELAKRIKELTSAPPIEDYRGPILFEKQAAAELFAQALAPRLTNKAASISSISSRFEAANDKIGRRILPQFLSVYDDPLAREYKGQQLKGGYVVDDEGVKAQKVMLVENGYLKTFCSGRTPSRDVKESNGHWIDGAAATSQLFITSTKTETLPKLKEQLIALGKEEGLEYVLIVRHISSGVLSSITPGRASFYIGDGNDVHITAPTLLYKVNVKTGKEELIRGANFTRLSHRLFRDIQAVGDDSEAFAVRFPNNYGTTGNSVVTPSVLISEVDMERESHENDMPMILKNSYFGDLKSPDKAIK
jgi:hypothetical protein